ncbi:AAA family ATPase [Polymorphospora lycopeni]|uniref:AAA family ATPase n=1 Tax=Polymorphospora lycopeni TaxID=3140240 RepID=A0ABV5CMU9_9ACTN
MRVRLNEDEARRRRQVEVVQRDEAPFSAEVVSDGTLRAIALLAALYDPRGAGLICFEEPENGIYPQHLAQFVRYLRNLVTRAIDTAPQRGTALTQLVLSSHSPAILRALAEGDAGRHGNAVFLDVVTRARRGEPRSRVTRPRWVGGNQLAIDEVMDIGSVVSRAEIAEFEVMAALDR